MEVMHLIKALTRGLVILVFWVIFLLSMLLSNSLSIENLLFILVKSILASSLLWVFLAIILDAIVKVMVADAREKKVERLEGGLSYHFAEPSEDEVEWQKAHAEEIDESQKK